MSQTFKLYRLQQLDSKLDQIKSRLNEIENILNDHRELRLVENEYNLATDQFNQATKALRLAEENVRAQRLKIEQTEATLYSGKVRNPKELQDLQNESAALKRYLAVLEDRQLEQMIAHEESETERNAAAERFDQEQIRSESLYQDLLKERAGLLDDVKRLEAERDAAISPISQTDRDLYKKLRQQRQGVAVARVTDAYCSACGSTLSSALLHAARSPNQITLCDTCGRILYGG